MLRKCLLLMMLFASVVNANDSEFVGSSACAGCHQEEFTAWQGSHHEMAMKHAADDSVKGDFNNVDVVFNGGKNRFYRKGKEYWVALAEPDHKINHYQIKYTFGLEPLQQYMVEFDDGRVQLIPFAWDSRPSAEGGERWFYLYPDHQKEHQEFYWKNVGQNWNYMCADCHSTNLKRNFDVKANTYQTTFSEISVGCEACHGPAAEHLAWSKKPKVANSKIQYAGFDRDISQSVKQWGLEPGAKTTSPKHVEQSQQPLVCAQCHSRHAQISDKDFVASKALGDRYILTLIDGQHYYPDGQVYDEDYVYGSFLQSKMHQKGVVCSNCHDPHTAKLKLPEEKVCLQCHQPTAYDTPEHHHHEQGSAGAQCVNCHMPETTYMTVDKRRDHSWHIPKPELSMQLSTPDACLRCHQDKTSEWSVDASQAWIAGSAIDDRKPFAPVFAAADQGYPKVAGALSHIAQNTEYPTIIRASALERLARFSDANSVIATAKGAKNEDEFIRLAAVRAAESMAKDERWRVLAPLLKDKVLAVRIEAAAVLVPLWQQLGMKQRATLQVALDEYLQVQDFNADRGFSHVNKANILVYQGEYYKAEQAYRNAIRIEPYFANAYLYLADIFRRQGREQDALSTLQQGRDALPDDGLFPYHLAMVHIRTKQSQKAISLFQKAIALEPENVQFHYVYSLSLQQSQPQEAEKAMRKTYDMSRQPEHLYALCEMQINHASDKARLCVEELKVVAPPEAVKALQSRLP